MSAAPTTVGNSPSKPVAITAARHRARKEKTKTKAPDGHPIRATHIRNIARRYGIQRLSNHAEFTVLVRETLLTYVQSLLEKMIRDRESSGSHRITFDAADVESAVAP